MPKRITNITQLPKIMIKIFGSSVKDVHELEQAKYLLNFDDSLVIVDGQQVHSYDELVRVITQEKYNDQKLVEVVVLPAVEGG